MIDLGATEFVIEIADLSRRDLERYSTELFDEWEAHVNTTLRLPDYGLILQI